MTLDEIRAEIVAARKDLEGVALSIAHTLPERRLPDDWVTPPELRQAMLRFGALLCMESRIVNGYPEGDDA